jgi:hypothetical protein
MELFTNIYNLEVWGSPDFSPFERLRYIRKKSKRSNVTLFQIALQIASQWGLKWYAFLMFSRKIAYFFQSLRLRIIWEKTELWNDTLFRIALQFAGLRGLKWYAFLIFGQKSAQFLLIRAIALHLEENLVWK